MNKNDEMLPFYENASKLLEYNSKTGEFIRKVHRSSNAKKGSVAGTVNAAGYRTVRSTINKRGKVLLCHRLAWFMYYGELPSTIDHVDRDRSNNSICNLRSCSRSQNGANRGAGSNSKLGVKGCLLYTSPSPRDRTRSRMPSSA